MPAKRLGKLSQREMAKRAGVTTATLGAWKKEGLDITDEAAVLDRAASVKSGGDKRIEKLTGNEPAGDEDPASARLRKLRAEADMLEHKLAVERGKYVSRESQLAAGMQFGLVIRGAFQKMAQDLTPRLAGRTSAQCSKILHEYARAKLTELSQYECDIRIPSH
jgi:transcriptional regulator with XRE-family HTH domain